MLYLPQYFAAHNNVGLSPPLVLCCFCEDMGIGEYHKLIVLKATGRTLDLGDEVYGH